MDETEAYEPEAVQTVGQTLRAAREEQGKSIEDIAAATRIPTRHLESLENSEWEKLPAPTYTLGFARAYANEVGLDRAGLSDRLREEMGGFRPTPTVSQDYFAPTDPKRTIPLGLVAGVVVGLVVLAIGLNWLLNRDLNAPDNVPAENAAENVVAPPAPPPLTAPAVVITASEPAWDDIRDGDAVLKQGLLAPAERFEVPASALSPTISTAKPEALTINVGPNVAPPIGPPGRKVDKVSLKAGDLMAAKAPATSAPSASPASTTPAPTRRTEPKPVPSAPAVSTPPAAPVEAPAATDNGVQ